MIPRLHELLTLERPLVGVDLETTGVNVRTDAVCQIALEIMKPGEPPREYKSLIKPIIPIPAGATAVHGITNADVNACQICGRVEDDPYHLEGPPGSAWHEWHPFKPWPTFLQVANRLHANLVDCDFAGRSLKNFDLPLLVEEFRRAGIAWSYEGARIVDSHRLWQVAEGRTLSHGVKRWIHPLATDREIDDELNTDGAHDALWDIRMSTREAAAMLTLCPELPRNLQQLHELQWPDQFDGEGKLRWRDGELCLTFGEHRDKPLQRVPRGYLQWVCDKDFSDKVKGACRDAMRKVFHHPLEKKP